MISPLRLQANRRNALRRTSPKTDAGKQRSQANAIRHGLTAEAIATATVPFKWTLQQQPCGHSCSSGRSHEAVLSERE
jgi:hypothetical protein